MKNAFLLPLPCNVFFTFNFPLISRSVMSCVLHLQYRCWLRKHIQNSGLHFKCGYAYEISSIFAYKFGYYLQQIHTFIVWGV
jgi:hypothetical protein